MSQPHDDGHDERDERDERDAEEIADDELPLDPASPTEFGEAIDG